MKNLLHVKYTRLNEENPPIKSANVSKKTLQKIKTIPWINILDIEKCKRNKKEDYLLK